MLTRSWMLIFLLTATVLPDRADAAVLLGRVADHDTGTPLEGVNIEVLELKRGGQTGPEGYFRIENLDLRAFTVRATRIGYAPETKRMTLDADTVRLDFLLKLTALPGDVITVTATRAVDRETPVTFSNITRGELEDRFHTQGIPTLLSELPSSTTYSESGNAIGYNYLTLRGFDQRRISVMINGVPQNDPEDHNVYWVNFPDLASSLQDIQVQRGSGSAFYGPAAIGGSINLVTERFSREPKLTVTAGYGSYDTRKLGVTLNSGLVEDRLALHAHFSKTMTDGYRNGAWVDFLSYFFGAAYYTEASTARLHIYGSLNRDHLNFYGTARFKTVDGARVNALRDRTLRRENPIVGDEEIEDFHQPHYELIHEQRLSPSTTLHNTLFYVQGGGFFDFDGSWADTTYYRLTAENGFTPDANPGQSLIRAFVNNRQGGWLPRLSYRSDRSKTEAGLELRYHQSLHWGKIRWAENLPPEIIPEYRFYEYKGAKWIVSPYLNHNHRATDQLNLMVNLQLAYKRYGLFDEKFVNTAFTVPYTFFNPQVGANYNLSDRLNFYLNFSRTSREPRRQNLYDASGSSGGNQPEFERRAEGAAFDFDRPLAKPEKLNDIEIGAGYRSANVHANVNLFWMNFRDEIVKNGQLDLYGQPVTGNADKTLHRGIEWTTALRVARPLTLGGNLSYSRNTFEDHTIFEGGQPIALDGNPIAGFPNLLANARLTYEENGFRASLSAHYVGKKYTDNTQNNRKRPELRQHPEYVDLFVEPYTVLNLSLAYDLGRKLRGKRFEIRMDLNNLLDRLYETHGEGASFFPAATRSLFLWTKVDI